MDAAGGRTWPGARRCQGPDAAGGRTLLEVGRCRGPDAARSRELLFYGCDRLRPGTSFLFDGGDRPGAWGRRGPGAPFFTVVIVFARAVMFFLTVMIGRALSFFFNYLVITKVHKPAKLTS